MAGEGTSKSADVLLLDASFPQLHAKQHIPGAVPVDVFTLASFGVRDVPTGADREDLPGNGRQPGETRRDVRPGRYLVRAAGLLLSSTTTASRRRISTSSTAGLRSGRRKVFRSRRRPRRGPKPGSFRITRVNEDERARPAELVAASGDRANNVLVDALGPEYHYGATAFFNKAGHIPNAVLLPSEDFFNADKTFKSPEEIKRMLAHLGVRPEQAIHAHCGGGGAAAVPYFALKHIAGYPKVKLSVESQMGWLQDERDLPFWTYAAPAMMRETDWLASWGGKMMRMYGVSRVSVIDVRPARAYAEGPRTVRAQRPGRCVPQQCWKPRRSSREILGAAGVDAAHEAVIVSGAGLTKEAALAYVMLEKLGQKKVSVFMDSLDSIESLDKMARRDFAVTKDPPRLRPPPIRSRFARTAPSPTRKAASGVYAEGIHRLGSPPAGQVTRGEGRPRPVHRATEESTASPRTRRTSGRSSTKAGVPRYAELVAFSDDPGEAAANYFVLRLMGYPDIKVLMS